MYYFSHTLIISNKSTHVIAHMKAKMMLFLMVKTDLQNLLR